MGPILAKKSLKEGPISQNCVKIVKSGIFVVEKPLEMSPDLQKLWGKKRKNQPFLREKNGYGFQNSGPTPRQKIIWVRATSMGSKISLLVIWMTAYKKPNFVYKWVDVSKFPQTWAKIGLDLRKNLGKMVWFCSKFCPKLSRLVH